MQRTNRNQTVNINQFMSIPPFQFSVAQFAFVWFRISLNEFDPRVPFAQKRIRAQHFMLRPGKHYVGHVTECYSGGQPSATQHSKGPLWPWQNRSCVFSTKIPPRMAPKSPMKHQQEYDARLCSAGTCLST